EGYEIGIKAQPFRSEIFTWSTTLNYSRNYNLVTKLQVKPEGMPTTGDEFYNLNGGFTGIINVAMVGKPLGVFHGYGWARENNGTIKYTTWDPVNHEVVGDWGGLNYVGAPILDEQLKVIGDPNPDFMVSWRNDLVFFKDLTISFLFDAVIGGDVWNGTKGALYNFGTAGATADRADPWNDENGHAVYDYSGVINDPNFDESKKVIANKQEKYWTYYNGFNINEPHIEDGSFVKLRELTLEYRWHGLQEWNISSIIFSLSARNLLTITNYKGYDPEVNTFSLAEGRGYDYFTLPQVRSFRFAISVIY
ncbi:MAG: hypothetical protein WCT77_01480, partial [Bacteroidota bacterium]